MRQTTETITNNGRKKMIFGVHEGLGFPEYEDQLSIHCKKYTRKHSFPALFR